MKEINKSYLALGGLVIVTLLSGTILSSTHVSADDSVVDDVTITVPVSCSMSGNVDTAHTATLNNGIYSAASGSDYENGIGKTTLTTFCNDYNGFSIYAIGYTNNTEGTNTLIGQSTGQTINTAVYSSSDTTSSWSMKLTKVNDTSTSYLPNNLTITNSFDNYHTVPTEYTQVASYHANTGSSATDTVLGSKLETTYAAYISNTQAADTYEGKVKYVLVHPYDAAAPLPTPPSTCNTPVPGITYMQDINSTNKASVLASLTQDSPYYLYDNRDNTPYCVGKLADGNLWMLDNLALDLTNSTVLNGMNSTNTHASDTTLGYLKNGGGTSSDRYAITGVVNWTDSPTYASGYSYSDPLVNLDSKDVVPTSYNGTDDPMKDIVVAGNWKIGGYYNYCAATAGSYCYGDGTSYGTSSGKATEDICPVGWRMPTGNTSGEYSALANAIYGSTSSTSDATAYANYRMALHLPLSGSFGSGSPFYQGSYGIWWSSARNDNYRMYSLNAGTYTIYPASNYQRRNGYSLRCILGS